jgi:hypothetical protein
MSNPEVLPRVIRDDHLGELCLRAAVLGAGTTERPGAPRWTELTVYRLPQRVEEPPAGEYVVAKVGRSVMAHHPSCRLARPRVMARLDPRSVMTVPPVRCLECLVDLSSPDTLLERTKFQVLRARTPGDLLKVLLQGRPGTPPPTTPTGVVAEVVRRARQADADFDRYCTDHLDTIKGADV